MKKSLCGFLVLLFSLITHHAFAEADGPDYWKVHGVEKGDVLNIRREANWKSEKIGDIPPDGQCIKNLRCVGGLTFDEFTTLSEAEKDRIKKERPRWCYIEYKGVKGWVVGRHIREGACASDSNVPKN